MWQDAVIPYNEDKRAKLNQINTGGPTDVNIALMGQPGQMNGDHTNVFPRECKCRSEEEICDFLMLLLAQNGAEGTVCLCCCFENLTALFNSIKYITTIPNNKLINIALKLEWRL